MDVTTRAVAVLSIAVGAGALACTSPRAANSESTTARQVSSPAPTPTSHGWPVLDRLERLCEGRVYGTDQSEISWELFTSPNPPDEVVARYRSRLGDSELQQLGDEWTFRVGKAGRVGRTLSITPRAPPPARSDCPSAPEGTRTFVMFSSRTSR